MHVVISTSCDTFKNKKIQLKYTTKKFANATFTSSNQMQISKAT